MDNLPTRVFPDSEITADPIFLFQKFYRGWDTEYVFFTREEAEEWGRNHAYRYKRWRVFCVCAKGELAKLLKARTTREEAPRG